MRELSKLGGRERGLVKIVAVVLLNGVVDFVTKKCFFKKVSSALLILFLITQVFIYQLLIF